MGYHLGHVPSGHVPSDHVPSDHVRDYGSLIGGDHVVGRGLMFEEIITDRLCPPPEPYSHALRHGDTVYLAGQVAFDRHGNIVGSTTGEQAVQVWKNIADLLEAAGGSLANIIKVTYYMQDIRELHEEIELREKLFAGRPFPVVTAIQAAALGLPGLKMEVDVTAVIPQ